MADDVTLPGTGENVAAEETGGKKYQKIKIALGGAGSATLLSSGAGAVDAGTPRVTLASDDPLVASVLVLRGLVDTLEALIGTTNSTLTTVDGRVDGLEALITTLNGYLDTFETVNGTTAWDLGLGATGSRTQRIAIASDSAGVISTGSQAAPATQYVSTVAAGDVAHDAVDSGNPQKIGGQARTTNPTAATDADRVNAIFDKLGKQIVVGAIRELKGVQQTALSNTTSETTIVTAVASTFLDLYGLILANTGVTDTTVTIKDATAGTTRGKIRVPAGDTRGFMLPVDSAVPQVTVNNNWTATCSAATTALEVTALYVKNT